MSVHDPRCPGSTNECICVILLAARADERRRVADGLADDLVRLTGVVAVRSRQAGVAKEEVTRGLVSGMLAAVAVASGVPVTKGTSLGDLVGAGGAIVSAASQRLFGVDIELES